MNNAKEGSDKLLARILKNFKWDINQLVHEKAIENKNLAAFHEIFLMMNQTLLFYESESTELVSYFREEVQQLQEKLSLELDKPKKVSKVKFSRKTTALTKEKLKKLENKKTDIILSEFDDRGPIRNLKMKPAER